MKVFCVLNLLYTCLEYHQDPQIEAIGNHFDNEHEYSPLIFIMIFYIEVLTFRNGRGGYLMYDNLRGDSESHF